MKDTSAYKLKDSRVLIISYKGSTVFFTIENPPFNPLNVSIKSDIVGAITLSKVAEFTIDNKTELSFNCILPHTTTENLDSIPEYLSDIDIQKKLNSITTGKYYFDIEVTENNTKYKIVSGILILKPEVTTT